MVSAVLLSLTAAGRADDGRGKYVMRGMVISGERLYSFRVAGEDATAVIGRFSLTVGDRTLGGDNAIVWMKESRGNAGPRRDITVYIEGKARTSTGESGVLSGPVMLVTLRQQGRVSAEAKLVAGPPPDMQLYMRALAARQDEAGKPVEEPSRHEAPVLLAVRGPEGLAGATTKPATRPAADTGAPAAKPGRKAKRGPRHPAPVTFHAKKFSTELSDPKDPYSRRITVAIGDVYFAQGNRDSRQFLEMRCQSAVLYSRLQKEDAAGTASDGGGAAPLGGGSFGQGKEQIEAVYLEDDAVIARGERYMRGPRAFYNFTTDRAYVVDGIYRTVQEQRAVPIFVRFKTARSSRDFKDGKPLPNREMWFKDARVTTSDFYSPTYHIAARTVRMKDMAAYDDTGVRLGPEKWEAWLHDNTFNIQGIPVMYWPYTHETFSDGHTALRKLSAGDQGRQFGFGVETEWRLFRLLGLPRPSGFKGRLEMSYYERGALLGGQLNYSRPDWSGYTLFAGMVDNRHRDDFGDNRKDINVPNYRGRFTHRHKQFLQDHWQVQYEFSWYSDGTFPETFYPAEFHGGKGQETLLYAKKQTGNQALTALLQYRLNRFDTQTESAPDVAYHLIGEPLAEETFTLFSETRAGMKRWRPAKATASATIDDSHLFPRVDTREEINWPLHFGPLNVVPYAVVRGTYWDDTRIGFNEQERFYGQIGARANVHIWRVYKQAENRLLDVHGLKHVVTPELAMFSSDFNGVTPEELLPIDPDVEQHLMRQSGYTVGVRQRLLTKRGMPGKRKSVDWMRLDVMGGGYRDTSTLPADGRFFTYRPEYGLARSFVNVDYLWNISDSTTLLADFNHDTHTGRLGKWSMSMNVERSPRLSYFGGVRYIRDLNSSVGTFGATYSLSRKYSMTFYEQYDFQFERGDNISTRLTFTRKFPRWYAGLTFVFDRGGEGDDVGIYLTFWPEGAPEVKVGSGKRGYWQGSDMN